MNTQQQLNTAAQDLRVRPLGLISDLAVDMDLRLALIKEIDTKTATKIYEQSKQEILEALGVLEPQKISPEQRALALTDLRIVADGLTKMAVHLNLGGTSNTLLDKLVDLAKKLDAEKDNLGILDLGYEDMVLANSLSDTRLYGGLTSNKIRTNRSAYEMGDMISGDAAIHLPRRRSVEGERSMVPPPSSFTI